MDDDDEGDDSNLMMMVAIVILAVVLIIVCGVGLKFFCKQQERQKEEDAKAKELKDKVVTMKDVREQEKEKDGGVQMTDPSAVKGGELHDNEHDFEPYPQQQAAPNPNEKANTDVIPDI